MISLMNKETAARFNARLTIASSFIADLTFILPVWLLYSLNTLNYSPTLSITVFMSIWITSAVMEVPTGALADRLGRKKIFIIGQFLFSLYPLAYTLEFPVGALFAVVLISGLGSAMRSGTLRPLVHRSYALAGLGQDKYESFLSNTHTAGFIARAATGVLGAALYAVNPKWPFVAMFLATLGNFVLGFFIQNPKEEERIETTNRQHIKQTIAVMKKSRIVVVVVASFLLFNLVAEAVWTGYQVFFADDGRSAITIGVLFSVIAILSAGGAYLIRFLIKRIIPIRIIQIYGLGILLTTVLLSQPDLNLRLLAVVPMAVMSGMTIFTLDATVQKHIENKYHSTALSIVNFVQYATYGVGSLLLGLLVQAFGYSRSRVVLMVSSLIMFMLVVVYSSRQKRLTNLSGVLKRYQKTGL
jgi:MFS family permease